jgi:hypothetical protein
MTTMNMRTAFAALSSAIFLIGCDSMRVAATATEAEICRQIGYVLPTRSRSDTAQTRDEITELYAGYSLTCPDWRHLIP